MKLYQNNYQNNYDSFSNTNTSLNSGKSWDGLSHVESNFDENNTSSDRDINNRDMNNSFQHFSKSAKKDAQKNAQKCNNFSQFLDFESQNTLFSSTLVDNGHGILLVLAVGADTLYGKTTLLNIDSNEEETDENSEKNVKIKRTPPLVRKLTHFANDISYWAYRAAIIIALFNLFQAVVIKNEYDPVQIYTYFSSPIRFFKDIVQSLMLSVIMCVVSIPEGLPASVALVLSLNMKRLFKQNVLVRKLIGIATAGQLTTLFIDKSGSLTKGKFSVQGVVTFPQKHEIDGQNGHIHVHDQYDPKEYGLESIMLEVGNGGKRFERGGGVNNSNMRKDVVDGGYSGDGIDKQSPLAMLHKVNRENVGVGDGKDGEKIDQNNQNNQYFSNENENKNVILDNFLLFCLRHSCGKATVRQQKPQQQQINTSEDSTDIMISIANKGSIGNNEKNFGGKKTQNAQNFEKNSKNKQNDQIENRHNTEKDDDVGDSYDLSGCVHDDEDDEGVVGGNSTDRAVLRHVLKKLEEGKDYFFDDKNQNVNPHFEQNNYYNLFYKLYSIAEIIQDVPFSSAKKFAMRKARINEEFLTKLNLSNFELKNNSQNNSHNNSRLIHNISTHSGPPQEDTNSFDPFTLLSQVPQSLSGKPLKSPSSSTTTPPNPTPTQINKHIDLYPNNDLMWIIKGAPEIIMNHCDEYYIETTQNSPPAHPLPSKTLSKSKILPHHRKDIAKYITDVASNGYRIIAIATAPSPQIPPPTSSQSSHGSESTIVDHNDGDLPKKMTLVAILLISDEIRNSTLPAIILAHHAGIRCVMISGDNINTCIYIAKVSGLANPKGLMKNDGGKNMDEQNADENLRRKKEELLADICNMESYLPKPLVPPILTTDQALSHAQLVYRDQSIGGVQSDDDFQTNPQNNNSQNNSQNNNSKITQNSSQFLPSSSSLFLTHQATTLLDYSYMSNFSNTLKIPFNLHFLPLLIHAIANQYKHIALSSYHVSMLSLVDLFLLMPKIVVIARALPQDKLKMVLASHLGYDLLVMNKGEIEKKRNLVGFGNNNQVEKLLGENFNDNFNLNYDEKNDQNYEQKSPQDRKIHTKTSPTDKTTSDISPDTNSITVASQRFTLNGNLVYKFAINPDSTIICKFYLGKFVPYSKLSFTNLQTLFTHKSYDISSLISSNTSKIDHNLLISNQPTIPPSLLSHSISLSPLNNIPQHNQITLSQPLPNSPKSPPKTLSTSALPQATPPSQSLQPPPHHPILSNESLFIKNAFSTPLSPQLPSLPQPPPQPSLSLYTPNPHQIITFPPTRLKAKPYQQRHLRTCINSFTGDGSNDVMAMGASHVAYSLAKSGTPSAQAGSDILLLTDSLLPIISSIWYGRSLYQNIRNFIQFQISANVGICTLLILAPFIHIEWPLNLGQLLFLNLVIDTVASTCLAAEPPSLTLLAQKPLHPHATLINSRMKIAIFSNSIYICLLSIFFLSSKWLTLLFSPGVGSLGHIWYLLGGSSTGQADIGFNVGVNSDAIDTTTTSITTNISSSPIDLLINSLTVDDYNRLKLDTFLSGFFIFFILLCSFHCVNVRSTHVNVFNKILKNRFFVFMMPGLCVVLYLFTVIPMFRSFLRTVPLTITQWVVTFGLAGSIVVFEAMRKIATIYYFEVYRNGNANKKNQSNNSNHSNHSNNNSKNFQKTIRDEKNGNQNNNGFFEQVKHQLLSTFNAANINNGHYRHQNDLTSSDDDEYDLEYIHSHENNINEKICNFEEKVNFRQKIRPSALMIPTLPPVIYQLLHLIHQDDSHEQILTPSSLFSLVERYEGEILTDDGAENEHLLGN
jgi:magnesium-transporting ATPase (P-type)